MLIIKHTKNIKNNQSMNKKLCAPHPEIKVEADACFETKNWALFHN
jgi:hypothetical protein